MISQSNSLINVDLANVTLASNLTNQCIDDRSSCIHAHDVNKDNISVSARIITDSIMEKVQDKKMCNESENEDKVRENDDIINVKDDDIFNVIFVEDDNIFYTLFHEDDQMIINCAKENNVCVLNDNVEVNNESKDENDSEIYEDVSCKNNDEIEELILDVIENDKVIMNSINVVEQCVEYDEMYNASQCILNHETDISQCLFHVESINNSVNECIDYNAADCNTIREGDDHNFFEEVQGIARKLTILTDVQRDKIVQLLCKYETLFTEKAECPDIYYHQIRLITSKPIVRKSYPVPFAMRAAVDAEINHMLRAGIIERSNSSYCNPLRIVTKKNGDIRICLDARHLNAVIDGDNGTPPPINEILQKYYGKKFFTTTDLACGYWQIPLELESRKFTAFLHGSTLYQFKRIPFGLKTAGSGFIRALSMALGNLFSDFLTCYIDD